MDPIETEADLKAARKIEAEITHTENFEDANKSEIPALTKKQAFRFQLKMDFHVLPTLGVMYALSIIDRINIGSAKVLGMSEDLSLGNGPRYSIVLLLFFPGYALADVPSNWVLTKIQPRIWLPIITFSWGAVLCGMAFVNDYQVLAFLRFLLGLAEGGILPGLTFTIACWYTRGELHKRISVAYALGLVASALAGILSYGLGQMDGMRGMRGWRWIFSVRSTAFPKVYMTNVPQDRRRCDDGHWLNWSLFVPKFPDSTTWLTHDRRVYLYHKLQKDRGHYKTESMTWKSFLVTVKEPMLWLQGSIYAFNVGTANAIGFFTPTIITGLGYSGLDASLRSGYPFFAALGTLAISAYISDRYQCRALVAIVASITMISGFSIMRQGFSNNVRYFGIFLATCGVHANTPALLAFNQTNTLDSAQRAASAGILIACGAMGSIIGSLVFRGEDAPAYEPGIYTTIGLTAYMVFALGFAVWVYWGRNRSADRDGRDIEGVPGFRYSL